MATQQTLASLLRAHGHDRAGRPAPVFVPDLGRVEDTVLTYGGLDLAARRLAG